VTVVNLPFMQGIESAIKAGVDIAIGDFVYEFESCRMDYPEELILECYNHLLDGFDIVSAATKKRRLSSTIFYKVFNHFSDIENTLLSEAFRVVSRRAINRIESMNSVITYRKALYANCGLKSDKIYYQPLRTGLVSRSLDKSRHNNAVNAFIFFTDIFYRFAIVIATLMMAGTFAGILYVIVISFFMKPVPGYVSIMLFMAGAFFALFALMAIIIKYLSVVVKLILQKQPYIFESIRKL
jgi:dolichol-phosphate mannosyltransferase